MTERFAQLTFASADREGRSGGWQVLQTSGGLGAAERTVLTDGILPRLPDGEPVPSYPSAAEVEALPRRLVYGYREGIGGVWWHTAPCGRDGQGRPGNVFVHVLLDRAAGGAAAGALRPSDLAGRGAGWLCPFGQHEVLAADLDAVPGPPWPPVPGRARVLEFLGGRSLSVGALCALLDAVDAALRGGPTVVLGLRDPGTAADWVAAVCHLMAPGAARRFTWSTWERAADLVTRPPTVHLAVVPHGDAALLGDRAAVLVEDEQLPRAERSEPPRVTRSGSHITVTPWSEMFYELTGPGVLPGVLEQLDRVAADAGEVDVAPAWPLAMVVAARAEEFPDALPAAVDVLEAHSPAALGSRAPRLHGLVLDQVAARIGPGVDAAWAAVEDARRRGATASLGVHTELFVLRAFADPSWRERTGPVGDLRLPAPASATVATAGRQRLEALCARLDTAEPQPVRFALDVLWFAELAELAGIGPGPARGPDRPPALHELYHRVADILLDRTHGPELAAAVDAAGGLGAAAPAVVAATAAALRDRDGEPGTRVAATVLRLLGVRLPRPEALGRDRPDALEAELAALCCLVDPDPGSRAWLVAVWAALDRQDEVDRLVDAGWRGRYPHGTAGWDGRSLAVLLTHPRSYELHRAVAAALLALPPGPAAEELARAARHRLETPRPTPGPVGGETPELRDALRIRTLAVTPAGTAILDQVNRVLAAEPVDHVADWIWQAVLAAYLAATVRAAWDRVPAAQWPVLAGRVRDGLALGVRDPAGRTRVARLLADDPVVDGVSLARAAICLRPGTAGAHTELGRVVGWIPADGGATPVDTAAALWASEHGFTDQDRAAVRARVREDLRGERGRGMRRDRATDPDIAVDTWWRAVVLGGGE